MDRRDGAAGHGAQPRSLPHCRGGDAARARDWSRSSSSRNRRRSNSPARDHHCRRSGRHRRGERAVLGLMVSWVMAAWRPWIGRRSAYSAQPAPDPAARAVWRRTASGVPYAGCRSGGRAGGAGILVAATFLSLGAVKVAVVCASDSSVATRPVTNQLRRGTAHEGPDGGRSAGRGELRGATLWCCGCCCSPASSCRGDGPIEVLLPFIAADRFEDGARMYGLVGRRYGVGGALGALGVSSRAAASPLPDGDAAHVGAGARCR